MSKATFEARFIKKLSNLEAEWKKNALLIKKASMLGYYTIQACILVGISGYLVGI